MSSLDTQFWAILGWQMVAAIVFATWVLSDWLKPEPTSRSWVRFAFDHCFYLILSVCWPLIATLLCVVVLWVLASHCFARRSP